MQEKIQTLLQSALACQQRGDLEGAEKACRTILGFNENQADALQFLGLIEETKGNISEAQALMENSLAVNPNQAHVLNNLANLSHDKGESEKAIELLKKALDLQPEYWDAWYNLGKVNFDIDRYDEAESALIKARDNWPTKEPRPHTLLGILYLRREDFEKSNENFLEALEVNPNHFDTLHLYGISLTTQQKPAKALPFFARALELDSKNPELFFNLGKALYEQKDISGAIDNFKIATELNPEFEEAHLVMNELLWRAGRKKEYAVSYQEALQETPSSLPLRILYLEALLKTDNLPIIEKVLEDSLQMHPNEAVLWSLKAKFFYKKGNSPENLSAIRKSIKLDPENVSHRRHYAQNLIKQGRFDEALFHMEKAHKTSPFDQEILAFLGLCWRLTGNPKEAWLNDYKNFIGVYEIPTPPGYSSLKEFNLELNKTLNDFHTDKDQPSDQTLRGGTQSIAGLLDKNVKEIQEARKSFEQIIEQFISTLPDDPDHPFLGRKSKNFTFENSWSIRLKNKGFHINHVHTDGWISSSYYVSLPDSVKEGKGCQGWIKFGETPLELAQEKIGRIVQPKEGLLVLFPSYMFHGTNPFQSDQPRTTIPFDVVPAGS